MKIVALDLGKNTGVFNGDDFPECIVFEGDNRLIEFWGWILGYLDEQQPDHVVIENALYQMGAANELFHEWKTCVKLACQLGDIWFNEVSPTHVKKVFVGNGKADKSDIIDKVLEMRIGLPYKIPTRGKHRGTKVYNDNAADAVAVYYTFKTDMEGKCTS